MTNPNDPAYPEILELKEYTKEGGDVRYFRGLSKREYFAAMAMKTVISDQSLPEHFNNEQLQRHAEMCCRMADALIAELNKEAKP